MAVENEWDTGLWAMADLVTPMAIRVAATLRIADHMTSGLRTATELAAVTNSRSDVLDRVMRHLATEGVLSRDGDGRYSLTARGEELREDHPAGTRAALDIDGAVGRADLSLVHLLHTVRTGEPGFPTQFGRSFWADLSEDPMRSASYAAQMGSDVTSWAPSIISAYDWGSLDELVDVGGGSGSLLIALLREYPPRCGGRFSICPRPRRLPGWRWPQRVLLTEVE